MRAMARELDADPRLAAQVETLIDEMKIQQEVIARLEALLMPKIAQGEAISRTYVV